MELSSEIAGRRSVRSSFREHASSFRSSCSVSNKADDDDDEAELQWAAIERIPTFRRIRTSLFDRKLLNDGKEEEEEDNDRKISTTSTTAVDVTQLGSVERRVFIDKLIQKIEEDNLHLLHKLKQRIHK